MSETISCNVNLAYCESLLRELERNPKRVPAYHTELVSAIEWLMDNTHLEADPDKKPRMAATEMRARLVLKRWKSSDVN